MKFFHFFIILLNYIQLSILTQPLTKDEKLFNIVSYILTENRANITLRDFNQNFQNYLETEIEIIGDFCFANIREEYAQNCLLKKIWIMNPGNNFKEIINDCSIDINLRVKVLLLIASNDMNFFHIDTNSVNRPDYILIINSMDANNLLTRKNQTLKFHFQIFFNQPMMVDIGVFYFYLFIGISIFSFIWYFIYFSTNTYCLLHQLMNLLFTLQFFNIFAVTIFYFTFHPTNPIAAFFEMVSMTIETVFDAVFIGFLISVGIGINIVKTYFQNEEFVWLSLISLSIYLLDICISMTGNMNPLGYLIKLLILGIFSFIILKFIKDSILNVLLIKKLLNQIGNEITYNIRKAYNLKITIIIIYILAISFYFLNKGQYMISTILYNYSDKEILFFQFQDTLGNIGILILFMLLLNPKCYNPDFQLATIDNFYNQMEDGSIVSNMTPYYSISIKTPLLENYRNEQQIQKMKEDSIGIIINPSFTLSTNEGAINRI